MKNRLLADMVEAMKDHKEQLEIIPADHIPEGWIEVPFDKSPVILDEVPPVNWDRVLEMADRREAAAKHAKPCPFCGSIQVQLTQWATPALQFKCRTCKQKFVRTI